MNNVTLPEVTVTPRNINLAGAVDRGRRTVGNMGKEILSATTPLGDIESAKDIYQDARSGNYGQAALGAGLLLLPNFIEKPLKALKRVGKKVVKASNKYPGRQALEQMLKEFSESGNEHAFITKYLNMKHPKRVWNALTGKYFVYPLIGTTLIGGMSYDRNE